MPGDIGPLMQMVRGLQREHLAINPEALTETLIRKAIFASAPTLRALVADTGVSLAGFAFYAPAFSVFRAGITWLAARNRPREQEMLARLGVRPHDNLRFVRMQVGAFDRVGMPAPPEWRAAG